MALVRECQPKSYKEWESWYFERASTKTKEPIKITKEILKELGERLYVKLTEIVVPEIKAAARSMTLEDCIDYVFDLVLCRTFDGYISEKSIVLDDLADRFPSVDFKESDPRLDHAGDIDFLGWINDSKAIGVQIKPVTAGANLGDYSVTARMEKSFRAFSKLYGGKVFIVYSKDEKIFNKEALGEIKKEIEELKQRR